MIKTFLYTIAFILAAAAIFCVTPWYKKYFEHVPPVIVVGDLPQGIGVKPTAITITVLDSSAGLDEVVVRMKQRARSGEILRQTLHGEGEHKLSLTMETLPFELEDGRVDIEIDAFDRSFYSNSATKEFSLTVDKTLPTVEAVTTQHNARQGGSQLVVYRARDKHLLKSGVLVKNLFFEGVKESECSQELPQGRDLYCVVYAIPMDANVSNDDVKLVAYDSTGNETTAPFYNRVAKRYPRPASVSINQVFLDKNASELTDEETAHAQAKIPASTIQVPIGAKEFKKPNGTVITSFGDSVRYMNSGLIKAQRLSDGYELTGLTDVQAMAAGQISFVGEAGPLGKIVVVEHGLRMSTVYGFLGDTQVHIGQNVEQGQTLGTVGESGLARLPGVYIEVLVGNTPVDANEWWTDSWYSMHILDKLKESVELATLLSTR